jgi:hypothetical protein
MEDAKTLTLRTFGPAKGGIGLAHIEPGATYVLFLKPFEFYPNQLTGEYTPVSLIAGVYRRDGATFVNVGLAQEVENSGFPESESPLATATDPAVLIEEIKSAPVGVDIEMLPGDTTFSPAPSAG